MQNLFNKLVVVRIVDTYILSSTILQNSKQYYLHDLRFLMLYTL